MKDRGIHETILRIGGPELLRWHKENHTEISATDYLRRYRSVLAKGISEVKRVYLDTNFWVQLRDAAVGRSATATRLLAVLKSGVASGRLLCVIHHAAFTELAKQSSDSLKATAQLVDELSHGVAVAPSQELRHWQAGKFIAAKLGATYDDSLCYWTKVGQIMHSELPTVVGVTPEAKRAIHKACLDTLWNASLSDIFAQLGWKTRSSFGPEIDEQTIAAVELRKKEQLKDKRTRERVRRHEFGWVLRRYYEGPFIEHAKQLDQIYRLGNEPERVAKGLLVAAFREFESKTLNGFLPDIVIQTELYSLYELDGSKKLSVNDWNDWQHASVALPYCQFFLTERHLAHQLVNVLKFDARYGCTVLANLAEAEAAIAAIVDI